MRQPSGCTATERFYTHSEQQQQQQRRSSRHGHLIGAMVQNDVPPAEPQQQPFHRNVKAKVSSVHAG